MPEPLLTIAGVFGGCVDWALGRISDLAASRVKAKWADHRAAQELTEIAERCVNAAAAVAPEIGDLLTSEAYIRNVLAPGILAALETPVAPMAADPFAEAFLERFVEPYLARRSVDDVLSGIFELEPQRLQAAFRALVAALRDEIWRSEHWKEPLRDAAIEETLISVRSVREDVAVLRALSAEVAPEPAEARLEAARADARAGSTALRLWPKRIAGLYLQRPELDQLMKRVREHPGASTLVVGQAGAGKSSLLSDLTEALETAGLTVFAIKADQLPADVRNLADVSNALGLSRDIATEIDALSRVEPVVLIIDQLDAVSDVMDRTSQRMRLMLQLATRWRARDLEAAAPAVHVVVSSRPFEAHHDARFSALGAEEVVLALPSLERVEALLAEIGISADRIPTGLRETVRRPFMLKLFVDLLERQADVGGLLESNLLTAWLTSAQLGAPQDRQQVVDLLNAMAAEMAQTETLWRPADRFDLTYAEAVRRAEACELLIRRGGLLGFAHQSWIDDFQARQFGTAQALLDHARAGQDSLFGRATLLRSLERLRSVDPGEYLRAVDGLLGDRRTRRHLRYLAAGFLAAVAGPLPQEVRWIERLVREDARLALHALGAIRTRWADWRAHAIPLIELTARTSETAWMAVQLGIAEAEIDPAAAEALLTRFWNGAEHDLHAFELCWRGALWSPVVKTRLEALFARATGDNHAIANYLSDLASNGRAEAAVELLGAYLSARSIEDRLRANFYGLEKIIDAAPLAYVRLVLPWFVEATQTTEEVAGAGAGDRYPRSRRLAFDWLDDHDQGGLFAGLHRAMLLTAQAEPKVFLGFVERLEGVEVDEVQAMAAEGFAAAGASLAKPALDWLLADTRRLQTGEAHLQDEHNIGHTSYDYATRLLLKAICGELGADDLRRLSDRIEAWDPYAEMRPTLQAKDLRDVREWAENIRAGLLALLPASAMTPRRRRQVAELAARQPKLSGGRGRRMAQFVGSPMTHVQMGQASDDQIFGMIDSVHDQTGFRFGDRRAPYTGGVSQLSQAFAAFGREQPIRAMALVRDRFVTGRHEACAGALVRQVAGDETVDAEALLALIGELATRGFDSPSWRHDAAWALHGVAARRQGLPDEEIERLESWLQCDPDQIAAQVARHDEEARRNQERRHQGAAPPAHALLFGRGGETFSIVPGANYPLLDAIAVGLLHRPDPAHGAWLDFLERHVERAEDPAILGAILSRHSWSLWRSDAGRVGAFFETLQRRQPRALEADTAHFLWVNRGIIPPGVVAEAVTAWFAYGGEAGKQLAGEFAVAAEIVDASNAKLSALAAAALAGVDPAFQRGAAFAAAAAWREPDEAIRGPAHRLLMDLAPSAAGSVAHALSTAVDLTRTLIPDDRTRELLPVFSGNKELLKACMNRSFAEGLQGLLLTYGFDEIVLDVVECAVEVLIGDPPQRRAFIDKDFVDIAIALQKSDGAQRTRAMDLYERLLDVGAYGAEQAAQDSLTR